MKPIKRRVKAWVAISPIVEGGNIYMPSGDFSIYESKAEGIKCGATESELVPCTITYTAVR